MPERRIDAPAKADAAQWSSLKQPGRAANSLNLLSGRTAKVPAGTVMRAVVQPAAQGAFKATLHGESFTFKGLPDSLLGKTVSFVLRPTQAGGKAGVELLWLGASGQGALAAKQAGDHQAARQTAHPAGHKSAVSKSSGHKDAGHKAGLLRTELLSSMPTGLKQQQSLQGTIVSHQAGTMSIRFNAAQQGQAGQHIEAASLKALKQGQQITFTLRAAAGNKTILEIQQPVVGASKQTALKLAAGELAAAMVQKRLPDGQALLRVQGMGVEAAVPSGVGKGDMLTIRMVRPPAEFQLVSVQKHVEDKAMSVLKSNLPVSREPLAQHLNMLRTMLPALTAAGVGDMAALSQLDGWLADTDRLDGSKLAHVMRKSGTGLESKLLSLLQHSGTDANLRQDLKAILLQLATVRSGGVEQGLVSTLTELAQRSTARIENTQALNVLAQVHGDPVRFELPLLLGQQLVNVQLSVQQEHQRDGQGRAGDANSASYSALFALELTGLGAMRVDASISDRSVYARIYSDDEQAGGFIRQHIQRLEERLQGLGYDAVHLLVSRSAPEPDKQRRFDQLTQMAPASSLLDIIA